MTTNGKEGQTSCECPYGCSKCEIDEEMSMICKECFPGFAYYNKECVLCEAGEISIGGDEVCQTCEDYTWSFVGEMSCRECPETCPYCSSEYGWCYNCIGGYFLNEGEFCEKCPTGTYTPYYEEDEMYESYCEDCDDMTYTNETGSISCKPCDNTCASCDPKTGECTECKYGYYRTGFTCTKCSPGSYSEDETATECLPCPKGTYQSEFGQDYCEDCDEMTYSDKEGSIKCEPCSKLCRSYCYPETGNCFDCIDGYELNKETGKCIECQKGFYSDSTTKNKCLQCPIGTYCDTEKCIKCKQCEENTYSSINGSSQCQPCDKSCSSCDNKNGNCLSCQNGYGINSTTNLCEICPPGQYSFNNKCNECEDGYYSNEGSHECSKCPYECDGTCEKTNGKCKQCKSGFEFNNGNCNECKEGWYSTGGIEQCKDCKTSCTTSNYCDITTGKCIDCQNGEKQITEVNETKCVSCSNDKFCSRCSTDSDQSLRKCIYCDDGYYLNTTSNHCIQCSLLNDKCAVCSRESDKCLECKGNYELNEGECNKCETNTVIFNGKCVECHEAIPNCLECDYNNELQKGICTKCYTPYEINSETHLCQLCQEKNSHFNNDTLKCEQNIQHCEIQIDNECLQCEHNYLLSFGKCIEPKDNCISQTIKTCEQCQTNVLTTNGDCSINSSNCLYPININEGMKCLKCKNVYENKEGICETNKQCNYYLDNHCLSTTSGLYVNTTNHINECENSEECQLFNNELFSFKCKNGYYLSKNKCISKENNLCKTELNGICIECNDGLWLSNGECIDISIPHCKHQISTDTCEICENNKLLHLGKCIDLSELNCDEYNEVNHTCKKCSQNNQDIYKEREGCLSLKNSNYYENCTYPKTSSNECFECNEGYELINKTCHKINQTTLKTTTNYEDHCFEYSTKGCIRCKDGYYINDYKCIQCKKPCEKCHNSTYCTGCDQYSNLVDGTCISMNSLIRICDNMWPNYGGCVTCKDGYHKAEDGRNCNKCHNSCLTCKDSISCITCAENHYLLPEITNQFCKPFNESIGCLNITQSGCLKCKEGMYLSTFECFNCPKQCLTCTNENTCQSCLEEYVLKENKCVHYKQIQHCLKASNSVCLECEKEYSLNTNKNECYKPPETNIVPIVVPIVVVVFIIIVVIIVIIVLFVYRQVKKEKEIKKTICVFDYKKSNILLEELKDNILSNKKELTFNDNKEEIPVFEETRELLCIGNKSKNRIKIQITTREGCDKYLIRTEPQLISLKKGEACEFEIFIKPLCTCQLQEEITIIALDIKQGKENLISLPIKITTEISTRLDYDELNEEKKIGEGSFGIVYLGTFRGNKVAIKKMKTIESEEENDHFDEFEKEVSMLDKFRSDYLIHFYGACFIPNKICMVTEYAQFGSLQDLIFTSTNIKPRMIMRMKLMVDASKGIQYLHDNGILHRDIKPDNFLVISLEDNVKVNCKLTDFGSSRNINMLMTNMTFTKGVGSPAYMAPEILNKQHYKMSADIYSFAITMYEVFSWEEAYPKKDFKFPWKIAEFVVSGQRFKKIDSIPDRLYQIICCAWKQEPDERPSVGTIGNWIEEEMKQFD